MSKKVFLYPKPTTFHVIWNLNFSITLNPRKTSKQVSRRLGVERRGPPTPGPQFPQFSRMTIARTSLSAQPILTAHKASPYQLQTVASERVRGNNLWSQKWPFTAGSGSPYNQVFATDRRLDQLPISRPGLFHEGEVRLAWIAAWTTSANGRPRWSGGRAAKTTSK